MLKCKHRVVRRVILGYLITQQVCTCIERSFRVISLIQSYIQIELIGHQLSRHISQHLGSFEDFIRQHERACAEMNQLQEDLKRKSQEIERARCELEVLRYRIPPSHQTFMVESLVSTSEAKIKELEKRMIEVKANIEDYGRKSKSSKSAIAELLEEDQTVREHEMAALLEAQQRQMAILENKLLTATRVKDDEIKRYKTRLNLQRIKLTTEHREACEKQEMYYMKSLREIEGRCQKALKSAETQHVTELQSKNQKIGDLESKVKKLEAQLLVRQSTVQKRFRKWFRRKKSTIIDESKCSGTVQKSDLSGELTNDSEPPKYLIHPTKVQDQASHASTISPPFYYDQYSLHSLPAMHFREILEQEGQDQSNPYHTSPNQVISPQESEDSAKGYRSEPEDDDIALLLNPRIDSTTAVV